MDVDNITARNMDFIFSMRASFQHYTIRSGLNTKDTVAQIQRRICKNAQRNLNNTRILLQAREDAQPFIEGLDTKGVVFRRSGVVLYVYRCPSVVVIPRSLPYCTQGGV